ncbi:uncharacterized protein LOC110860818 isoform X2 [Folsomia candida]|uniref:uncharacterized protein LOC110860818 isoform X2 n=1 Tax=Folsomia candida TaxID=158441 RepID=UPI001604A529|nr:uncharacterized protein LOC110860818 isoform X2 [Folsomia candida]XP_035716528.1 uncharacterized protein LOC110860818 isoform X2 [Folsomia candida]
MPGHHRCVVMDGRNLREDASRKLVWCTALNLDPEASYKGKVICSEHFLTEDMKFTRKLLPNATPKIVQNVSRIQPTKDLTSTSISVKTFRSRSTQSDPEPIISTSQNGRKRLKTSCKKVLPKKILQKSPANKSCQKVL